MKLSCWLIERTVGDTIEYYNSRQKKWYKDPLNATGFETIHRGDRVSKEHKLLSNVVKHDFNEEL